MERFFDEKKKNLKRLLKNTFLPETREGMTLILATATPKVLELCKGFGVKEVFSCVPLDEHHHCTVTHVEILNDLERARFFVASKQRSHCCLILPLEILRDLTFYVERDLSSGSDLRAMQQGSAVVYRDFGRVIVRFEDEGYKPGSAQEIGHVHRSFYDVSHVHTDADQCDITLH